MADRPILFSAPMVQALIAGRKTQTRRVLKHPMAGNDVRFLQPVLVDGKWCLAGETDKHLPFVWNEPPYLHYAPGDRLWVREAWSPNDVAPTEAVYRADHGDCACFSIWDAAKNDVGMAVSRWRPSIHMPRWASRLTLTVTDVRVQRLQDISEADAMAEDADYAANNMGFSPISGQPHGVRTFKAGFAHLWNSLHGPDAWDANPWVVAISFTVRKGNIDALDLANGRADT